MKRLKHFQKNQKNPSILVVFSVQFEKIKNEKNRNDDAEKYAT